MKQLGLAAVLLLGACGGSPANAALSPSPRAATSAPAPSSPSPSPVASQTHSRVPTAVGAATGLALELNCRLPVAWISDGHSTGGFVSFPSLAVAQDPSAPVDSSFYDRAFSRWVPVSRTSVSPDGTQYAYTDFLVGPPQDTGGKLHLVDVGTGADRVVYSDASSWLSVVDFSAEGIYIAHPALDAYSTGLWLVYPAGGQPRLISRDIEGPSVGDGAAWGVAFNSADPQPAANGPSGYFSTKNTLLRFDLSTGVATTWFYRPGSNLKAAGFDYNGHLYVDVDYRTWKLNAIDPYEVWMVTSSTMATTLYRNQWTQDSAVGPSWVGAVDSHGVWFDGVGAPSPDPTTGVINGHSSISLYASGSFHTLATFDESSLVVAGDCIR